MCEPQWTIAQGENVQGPFPESKVRRYIEAGRVRADMLFSRDGGDWVPGHEIPALFPPATRQPPPLPTPEAKGPWRTSASLPRAGR